MSPSPPREGVTLCWPCVCACPLPAQPETTALASGIGGGSWPARGAAQRRTATAFPDFAPGFAESLRTPPGNSWGGRQVRIGGH